MAKKGNNYKRQIVVFKSGVQAQHKVLSDHCLKTFLITYISIIYNEHAYFGGAQMCVLIVT